MREIHPPLTITCQNNTVHTTDALCAVADVRPLQAAEWTLTSTGRELGPEIGGFIQG